MDSDNDLFSASLDAIESSKRVEKFQRFITNFQREFEATMNNAQEWIKAELPLVANKFDIAPLKDELKSNKTTDRRKHLLSALIFEQATRDAVHKHQTATAVMMSIQMLNHIWQAKLELLESLPSTAHASQNNITTSKKIKEKSAQEKEQDLKSEQILNSLIKKGEKLKSDSQIQEQNASAIQAKPNRAPTPEKKKIIPRSQKDLWKEASKKSKLQKLASVGKTKKPKRKTNGVFSKVRTKIPLTMKGKKKHKDVHSENNPAPQADDSLLDDPNRSAIMVNTGLVKDIDDSLIQARPRFSDDPNESGITVRKVLKKRKHETHKPGSNTIIMKLASGAGNGKKKNMSVPEQCQHAVNRFYHQFPGYDIVAIRNLAAEKVGVSPQYIENLNILPENTN